MTLYAKACAVYASSNPIPLTPAPQVNLKEIFKTEDETGRVVIPVAKESVMDVKLPPRELLGYKVFIANSDGYLEMETQQFSNPFATPAEALEHYEANAGTYKRWPGQELLRSREAVNDITAGEEEISTPTGPDELGAWFDGNAPDGE